MKATCYICGHTGNYIQGGGFDDVYLDDDDVVQCLSCEQYICANKIKPCVIYDNGYFCVQCMKKCTSCDDIFHVDHMETCKKCGELNCYYSYNKNKNPCLSKDLICMICSTK